MYKTGNEMSKFFFADSDAPAVGVIKLLGHSLLGGQNGPFELRSGPRPG